MKSIFIKLVSLIFVVALFGCSGQKLSLLPNILSSNEQGAQQQFETQEIPPLTAVQNTKKVKVALFLPLSGKNKDLGQSLFNSAAMSLFENDKNGSIELVLVDSKEDPKGATQAFSEIANNDIKVVIGPVFSSIVSAIESDVKQKKITAISLSNNQQLVGKTNGSGGVFIAGMIPESQIDALVSYSLSQKKNNFAIIAPSSQYGLALNGAFKEIVKRRDAYLITSEFYSNISDKEIERVVDRVINSFRIPAALAKNAKAKKDVVINDSDRIYPQIIFVPESGKVLSKIAAALKRKNIEERKFILFGTSQWDDISTLDDYNLVGSLFVAPESEKFRSFERSYYQTYGQYPPRVSSIVYDLVAATVTLVEQRGDVTSPTLNDFVKYGDSQSDGFRGIDGAFRFLPNGLLQRNFAILKVGNGRFEVIEKANDSFLKY